MNSNKNGRLGKNRIYVHKEGNIKQMKIHIYTVEY